MTSRRTNAPAPTPRCQARRGDGDTGCGLDAGHPGNHQSIPVCPVPDCADTRRRNQIMCRTHWFRVPKALRDRIWALVKKGLSQEYLDARAESIAQAHLWAPRGAKAPKAAI